MLPPIFPRPTKPSCMSHVLGSADASSSEPSASQATPVPHWPGTDSGVDHGAPTTAPSSRSSCDEAWSAGEPHRHQDIAVGAVVVTLELGLPSVDPGGGRLGEGRRVYTGPHP